MKPVKQQRGFTLLELMVAMAIFAMLAVAGWQVFDGVNRARERAQYHADNLAVLQYAYLQLQQDMMQIIPYQDSDNQVTGSSTNNNVINNANNDSNGANNSTNNDANNQADSVAVKPFMSLDGEHIRFMRFADPDPRYQSSYSIQRIEYIFADERLIRRQYSSIQGGQDSASLDTILLEGITAARWQAYLPELSDTFPNDNSNNNNNNNNSNSNNANNDGSMNASAVSNNTGPILLPKGLVINFMYQDMPITWQWSLTPQPIPNNHPDDNKNIDNSNSGDSSNNSDNNNSDNNNVAGGIENIPTGQ